LKNRLDVLVCVGVVVLLLLLVGRVVILLLLLVGRVFIITNGT
jgi:hypothetical protein